MNAKLRQRVTNKFLRSEKSDAIEVNSRLLWTFQEDAYRLSSVLTWSELLKQDVHLCWTRFGWGGLDSKTLSLFTENKFHPGRTLAQELGIFLSKVHDRLANMLGPSLRYARWVPHSIADELKIQRVTTPIEMFLILQNRSQRILQELSPSMCPGSFSSIPKIGSGDWGTKIIQKRSCRKPSPKSTCSQSSRPLIENWLPDHGPLDNRYFCEIIITRLASVVFPDQVTWCK
jgi:hypothetical protein